MKAAADLVVRRGLGRGVVQLSLNQPGSFNALSAAMMQALALELDDVSKVSE
jgi:enoyl-CoA hydratase/carnithine racemase